MLALTMICHAEIVFTEDFEESTLDDVASHFDEVVNQAGMEFSADVPAASYGTKSLMMTSVLGSNTGGHLYKSFPDGYDSLYARFYTKFAASCHPIHHFVHMGGYNPPTPWPQGTAGFRPDGTNHFTTGIEPMGSRWKWDLYSYWMHMRGNPAGPEYWGNIFNPEPSSPINRNEWICVEVMMKCNSPVSSYNGEQAFWINGEQIIHLGEGLPKGYWIWDKFHHNSDSAGFEGFQWRIDEELKISFFWLLFYMTDGYSGQVDSVWFDDLVIATEYIGPTDDIVEKHDIPGNFEMYVYPNPFNSSCRIAIPAYSKVEIYNLRGRKIWQNDALKECRSVIWQPDETVSSGVYLVRITTKNSLITKRIIYLK
jgi:hypothetical protein